MMLDANYAATPIRIVRGGHDIGQHWTTSEAAIILDIPERRIRRLLQRGILKGFKVRGRCGDEWRIDSFDPGKIKPLLSLPTKAGHEGEHSCADSIEPDSMQRNETNPSKMIAGNSSKLDKSKLGSLHDEREIMGMTSNKFLYAFFNYLKMLIVFVVKGSGNDRQEHYTSIPQNLSVIDDRYTCTRTL